MITSRSISVKNPRYSMSFIVIEDDIGLFKSWLKVKLEEYGFEHCSIRVGAETSHFHVPNDVWTRGAIDEYLQSIYNQRSEVFIG